jgi:hypothetical protein
MLAAMNTDPSANDSTPEALEQAVATVREFLEEGAVQYDLKEKTGIFLVPMNINGNAIECVIAVESDNLIQFIAEYPVSVPKHNRAATLRCLNILNHNVQLGQFNLDESDGRVCFRITLRHSAHIPDTEDVRSHFKCCVRTAANAEPHLLRVFFGGMNPLKAADVIMEAAAKQASPELRPPDGFEWN